MKMCYPIVLSEFDDKSGYLVYVPDFDINTSGNNLTDAIDMARDAISLMVVDMEDDGRELPTASEISSLKTENSSDIVTLVDADIDAYRRMLDNRAVRKNCTIPSWLNEMAEQANINFSAVLQEALKQRLQIN